MSINDFKINLDNISHFIFNKENQKFWNDLYLVELKLNFVNCKEWFSNKNMIYFFSLEKNNRVYKSTMLYISQQKLLRT